MISEDYIKTMFPQSRLTILGGRPFMGKTSFEHLGTGPCHSYESSFLFQYLCCKHGLMVNMVFPADGQLLTMLVVQEKNN